MEEKNSEKIKKDDSICLLFVRVFDNSVYLL